MLLLINQSFQKKTCGFEQNTQSEVIVRIMLPVTSFQRAKQGKVMALICHSCSLFTLLSLFACFVVSLHHHVSVCLSCCGVSTTSTSFVHARPCMHGVSDKMYVLCLALSR